MVEENQPPEDDPWSVGSCVIRKLKSSGEVSRWLVSSVLNGWSYRRSSMPRGRRRLSSRTAGSPSQTRSRFVIMRDWFLTLDNDELVDLALTENGLSASVTAKGRLALGLYRPFPADPAISPSTLQVSNQDRTRKGAGHRDQRLSAAHQQAASRRQ